MNRNDFQDLAFVRLREAKLLLAARHYSGAFYLAGYAVECALKACIAKQTQQHDFPDKKRANDAFTHNLRELLKLAGIPEPQSNTAKAHWEAVFNDQPPRWSEVSRYETHPAVDAGALIDAISDPSEGVLQWIQQHW